ncbi:MAG: hypothetical protein R3D69_15180 [Xanthobacteraceae bacterium]
MTKLTVRRLAGLICTCTAIVMASGDLLAQAAQPASPPKPIQRGDILSGELLLLRTRSGGKRIFTYQIVSEGRRIPGPDGLCNLMTGPETFQIVTHSDAELKALKPLVGKTISIKADEMSCATVAGQVSDALVLKWSIVR